MANNYYNFPTPFIPGTKVRSEQVNTNYQGVEAGFDLLPTDPVSMSIGTSWFGTDVQGATVNDYLITTPDPQSALADGQRVAFFATHSNALAATINVDGLGVVNLVDNNGAALVANDIVLGNYYEAVYDNANTQFVLSLAAGDSSTFPQITATSVNAIDLVDADVALRVGAADPLTAQHVEVDPQSIQSKATATTTGSLNLNPHGGVINYGDQNTAGVGGHIFWQEAHQTLDVDQGILSTASFDIADPSVPDPLDLNYQLWSQDFTNQYGFIGFDSAADLSITNFAWTAEIIFNATNAAGVQGIVATTKFDGAEWQFLPDDNAPVAIEGPTGSFGTTSGGLFMQNGATIYMEEIAAAQLDIAGVGQIWVNNAFTPNRLFFTGDTGVDVDLTTVGGSPGGADTEVQFNNAGVFGGSASMTWDGLTFRATVIEAQNEFTCVGAVPRLRLEEAGVGVDQGTWEYRAQAEALQFQIIDDSTANVVTWMQVERSGTGASIQVDTIDITLEDVFAFNLATAGAVRVSGDVPRFDQYNADEALDQKWWRSTGSQRRILDDAGVNSYIFEQVTRSGTGASVQVDSIDFDAVTGVSITNADLIFAEKADHASTPAATFGALWLRNDAPNVLVFTDDAGTDWDLNTAAAGAAGANTQIQFNNAGAFGADANFTYNTAATTTAQLLLTAQSGLTTGNAFNINLASEDTEGLRIFGNNIARTQPLMQLQIDGAGGASATCLALLNQASPVGSYAISITGNSGGIVINNSGAGGLPGMGTGLDITVSNNFTHGIDIHTDDNSGVAGIFSELTGTASSGVAGRFYTDIASRSQALVEIVSDNATGGNGYGLLIQQDGNGNGGSLEMTGKGWIKFPATSTPSTDANVLDDYQEGLFTTGFITGGGSVTISTTNNKLFYTKIGRQVHCTGLLDVNSVSAPTGSLQISLPFALAAGAGHAGENQRTAIWCINLAAAATGFYPLEVGGTSRATIYTVAGGNFASEMQATSQLRMSFTYFTDE